MIKPSGVDYEQLTAEDLVIVDLNGRIVEGSLNPSSDVKTHLLLYREFADIGGVVHTHSEFATSWAQAGRAIPCYGTTHADYFHGEVPVTRPLTDEEIEADYEFNTGVVIAAPIQASSIHWRCPEFWSRIMLRLRGERPRPRRPITQWFWSTWRSWHFGLS